MENIDAFNIIAGEVLGKCYKHFPNPSSIEDVDIAQLLKDKGGQKYDPSYIDFGDPEYGLIKNSVTWLVKAGYLWRQDSSSSSSKYRLSPLGLEVLRSTPSSINPKESLGSVLAKGAKAIGKEAIISAFSTALSASISTTISNA